MTAEECHSPRHLGTLYSAKILVKNEGETKMFTDQKRTEFSASKLALRDSQTANWESNPGWKHGTVRN